MCRENEWKTNKLAKYSIYLFFRVLQERAKAKRAKERARLRKQQLLEQKMQQEANGFDDNGQPIILPSTINNADHIRSHSDPIEMDGDSYSDPIDLITNAAQQDPHGNNQMSRSHPAYNNPMAHRGSEYYHAKQGSGTSRDSFLFTDENYSNPIDMVKSGGGGGGHHSNTRRSDHSNGSRRAGSADDDSGSYNGPARPSKLDLRGPLSRPAQPM